MLTEDNFCRIQREMGAEYLSRTCMVYPRNYYFMKGIIYRFCHMSCPEVMDKLLNDEKSSDLISFPVKDDIPLDASVLDSPEEVKIHPERKYAGDIKDFFYDIISDKKLPLETCIILGALAAQSLTKLVEAQDYDRIPEALKTLKAQMHNGAQLKSIENIKPNYNINPGITDKLLREFNTSSKNLKLTFENGKAKVRNSQTSTSLGFTNEDGSVDIDRYIRAKELLEKEFESRPFAWRNLALNIMLERNVPFIVEDKTIFENYSLFVAVYAVMRHQILTIMGAKDKLEKLDIKMDTKNFIITFCAVLDRSISHSSGNLRGLLKTMQEFKITTPAYLALLVK